MKKKIKNYMECLYKKINCLSETPAPLVDKVIICGGLLFLFLVLGLFAAIKTRQTEYLLFAGVLSVFLLGKIYHFMNVIQEKAYESREGTVLKIIGRHGVLRWIRVSVESEEGEFSFWTNKGVHIEKGREYRFYFEKTKEEQEDSYGGKIFLGWEEIKTVD